ncbi:AMP-binding protein [Nonomuraea sp. NPDC050556]|uniref:AMP-binding protein n=1 Tax=Nonomuraea sp. NPDC050556 TaxID=3364369 RepID=UPI00379DE382
MTAHVDTFCRDRLPPPDLWPHLTDLGYPERLNCAVELLGDWAPERRCLLTPTEEWSYGDLRRRSAQVAQVLTEDLGLVPGNRVLLRGPNTPWLVACWFGVLQAGGVAVTTMPLLRRAELDTMCEIARPSIRLCDPRFLDELDEAVSFAELAALCELKSGAFTPVDTAADDVALVAFTSGTTGRPKATLHFHRDVLAIADTFAKHVLRPVADDLFTGTPPLGFTFGLGGLVVFPLRVGAATLLVEQAGPEQLADLVETYRATVLFTAPTAYRALLDRGLAPRLAGLRRCVSAGEPLPADVWTAFHAATGLRVIDGIGATELLHVFISAADDDIRPGATGLPVPGFQARIVDHDGLAVPDGVAGLLAVVGPTGCRYLDDERQLAYVRDGWNLTGDTYIRDEDGYFWFQARADDMIVSAGYNIAGPEVEAALLTHPDVLECGVVGAPDASRGTIVKAYVVLRPGAAATGSSLQAHVKRAIAPYKYPRAVEFVGSLPRTSNGKLHRAELRRWAQ